MSQENVELVYWVSDAFNQRDLDGVLALADPDIEYVPRIRELEGGRSLPWPRLGSEAGGGACSRSPPTSASRSRT